MNSSRRRLLSLLAVGALAVAACGDDDDSSTDSVAAGSGETAPPDSSADGGETESDETTVEAEPDQTTTDTGSDGDTAGGDEGEGAPTDGMTVTAGDPFPDERCAANEEAGTITFLTGFDFAAAASIVEVIVAEDKGYYDDLCLDVELLPSFSTANYPLVASGEAQFASGGSFSEVVAFADANDADLIAVTVAARTPIESLLVKEGEAETLEDLRGTTLGVKGKLPSTIEVMLLDAGLAEGTDFDTVLLDGFDPIAHYEIPTISGFSVWKSNEPGTLDRAGIGYELFDPLEFGVPGSFGAIFTTRDFVAAHPTAAEDFVRATMLGLADAVEDPAAAAETAVGLINAGGNPNFLSPEGEVFRWEREAALVLETNPEGSGLAIPDDVSLQEELDAAGAVGLFGDAEVPSAASRVGSDITAGIYDATGTVIWPS